MQGASDSGAGAWRLTANTKDLVTGKLKPVHRSVHVPDTKRWQRRQGNGGSVSASARPHDH